MKRIFLLIATNLAIMTVLGVVVSLLGLNRNFVGGNLDLLTLLLLSAVMGFGGAFISLWLSKTIAKWSTGAVVIDTPRSGSEQWLLATVARLAERAGIAMPQVAIYEGPANAFATGPSRSNALVAVSSGLLQSMERHEIEAVLAHEISHVANGDMVTLTLIQGVVNTFVFFLARVVGFLVDAALNRDDNGQQRGGGGLGYMLTVMVCQIVFGILASIIVMYFSRQREYRADAGAATLMGTPRPMVRALQRLGGLDAGELPGQMAASGIAGKAGVAELFASHPTVEQRIAALEQRAA